MRKQRPLLAAQSGHPAQVGLANADCSIKPSAAWEKDGQHSAEAHIRSTQLSGEVITQRWRTFGGEENAKTILKVCCEAVSWSEGVNC
jgi:hypothetical protein